MDTRLRTLVDEIRLVPADGGLRVEVRGALGGILRLASGDAPGQLVGAVPDMFGPVPVLCRSFDHILCSKGDEP
jgi:hypothetical protein